VRHQDDGALRTAHGFDAAGNDLERIDIEAESVSSRIASLAPARPSAESRCASSHRGKAFVYRAVKQALVHFHQPQLILHQCEEVDRIQFLLAAVPADSISVPL